MFTWLLANAKVVFFEDKILFIKIILTEVLVKCFFLATFLLPIRLIFLVSNEPDAQVLNYILSLFLILSVLLGAYIYLKEKLKKLYLEAAEALSLTKGMIEIRGGYETFAKKKWKQFFRTISNGLLVVIVLPILSFFYPIVGIFFALYWSAALLVLKRKPNTLSKASDEEKKVQPEAIQNLSASFFLLTFLIAAFDLSSREPTVEIFHAFLALILVRQLLSDLAHFLIEGSELFFSRYQFYEIMPNQKYNSNSAFKAKDTRFWSNIFTEEKKWLNLSINHILKNSSKYQCQLIDTGVSNEIGYIVWNTDEKYFVKIFNPQINWRASRELIVLNSGCLKEITLPFTAHVEADGSQILIFEPSNFERVQHQDFEYCVARIRLFCATTKPDSRIVSKMKLEKKVHERFDIERIKLLVDIYGKNNRDKENLKSLLSQIWLVISQSPLRYFIPRISPRSLVMIDGNPKLLSISNWCIEPFGYGYLGKPKDQELLLDLSDSNLIVPAKTASLLYCSELEITKHQFEASAEYVMSVIGLIDAED